MKWPSCHLVALACCLTAGCAEKGVGPETVPLSGKVVFTKGGKVADLADHSVAVQFESVEDPQMQAFGTILEDGSFTMVTQVENKGKPGVVPGTHRVRLNTDDSSARYVNPKFLNYSTFGTTVKAPAEKEVVLEVWK
jgi:hypothetical protein